MITLTLNNKPYQTELQTIPAILEELHIPSSVALIELNGKALLRREMEEAVLQEGDQIEILQIAAGG